MFLSPHVSLRIVGQSPTHCREWIFCGSQQHYENEKKIILLYLLHFHKSHAIYTHRHTDICVYSEKMMMH